jgi:hypothetical protein
MTGAKSFKKKGKEHSCNPSTWEAEAEGSRVRTLPGLHKETLSQKEKKKKKGGE